MRSMGMGRRVAAVCGALALVAGPAAAQSGWTGAPFTMSAPKGWQLREIPGITFKIAIGPSAGGFAANINVVSEAFRGTPDTYADANERTLSTLPQYAKHGRVPFKTSQGKPAVKLIATQTQQGKSVRQIFYFMSGQKGKMYVITASAIASEGSKFDALFDATARSFALK